MVSLQVVDEFKMNALRTVYGDAKNSKLQVRIIWKRECNIIKADF